MKLQGDIRKAQTIPYRYGALRFPLSVECSGSVQRNSLLLPVNHIPSYLMVEACDIYKNYLYIVGTTKWGMGA